MSDKTPRPAALAQPDIVPIELRQVLIKVNVTDITPQAAAVFLAQADSQVKVAQAEAAAQKSRADAKRAEADAQKAVAEADRDKHVRSMWAVVVGMCALALVVGAVVIAVGVLSKWNALAIGAITIPVALVLFKAAPSLIGWLLKHLGGGAVS